MQPKNKTVWHKSTGIVKYCSNTKWVMLDCQDEITLYYRYLFHIYRHKTEKLAKPIWAAHVTIVNGVYDQIPDILWMKHMDKWIEFEYNPCIKEGDDGQYFWMDVKSPQLEQIRLEAGLTRIPKYEFHLTIGQRPISKK